MKDIQRVIIRNDKYIFLIYFLLGFIFIPIVYHFHFIADDLIILKAVRLHPFPLLHDWEYSKSGMYRPIVALSYYINYKLFGYDPFPYYLFNIIFHVLNSFLIYLLSQKIFDIMNYKKTKYPGIIAGLVFLIIPQNVMNILWIPGRSDILAGTFVFSSLYFFMKYLKTNKNKYLLISMLLGVLAYASKETALLLNVYVLLILGLYYKYDKELQVKKIVFPYLLLTIIYFLFRFIIFGNRLFGESKLINYDIFSILKFFFYGIWSLWLPNDLLDVYYFYVRSDYRLFILVIPTIIIIFYFLRILFYDSKTKNLKAGFFVMALSVISLLIYVGSYPQMRLVYIHLPFVIIFLTLLIMEVKDKNFFNTLFISSYIFLTCFGLYSVILRSYKINNYYNALYSIIRKTATIKNSQFIFCPIIGRIGQSWCDPDIKSISSLLVYNSLKNFKTSNYQNLLSLDTYTYADYENNIEYFKLNSHQFIVKLKNGVGVLVPITSKKFKNTVGNVYYFNNVSGFKITALSNAEYRPGKSTECLINVSPEVDYKNTFLILWQKKKLKIETLDNFLN